MEFKISITHHNIYAVHDLNLLQPDRYERMKQLLYQMESAYKEGNMDAKPNSAPFNAVLIGCCCGTDDRESALRCVLETMDHLRRIPGVRPNQHTYPLVLRAIGLNTKPGERRDSLLFNEVENCVRDGLVCSEVISTVKEFLPKFTIPDDWRENVAGLGVSTK